VGYLFLIDHFFNMFSNPRFLIGTSSEVLLGYAHICAEVYIACYNFSLLMDVIIIKEQIIPDSNVQCCF